jgi:RimJ/RimL family protein N-acetyltransferase
MLVLQTEDESLTLQQFTDHEDDKKLFELIESNRDYWKDISGQFPNLESVKATRLAANDERELQLGITYGDSVVGWISLINYQRGNTEYGNWLGVWVDEKHTRLGYATIAARAAIKYVSDNPQLNKQVTTTTLPTNTAAIRVLEKVGFELQPGQEISMYAGELVFKLAAAEEVET